MNRTFSAFATAVTAITAVAISAPAHAQQEISRVAVIEVQRIVQDSAYGKETLGKVQRIQQQKQDELTKRQKDLRDLEEKIQSGGKSLSEETMEKLQKDYQGKAVELKRFQDDAQRELEDMQRKELGELEKRIMPVIDAYAKEKGFTVVFNKFQSGLLYATEGADITDEVIAKFNSQIVTGAPAAKPAAAAAPAKPVAQPKKN